jgi:hypothetical protein
MRIIDHMRSKSESTPSPKCPVEDTCTHVCAAQAPTSAHRSAAMRMTPPPPRATPQHRRVQERRRRAARRPAPARSHALQSPPQLSPTLPVTPCAPGAAGARPEETGIGTVRMPWAGWARTAMRVTDDGPACGAVCIAHPSGRHHRPRALSGQGLVRHHKGKGCPPPHRERSSMPADVVGHASGPALRPANFVSIMCAT